MKKEQSYGVIPIYKEGRQLKVLAVHQIGSNGQLAWTFPKGKREGGEKPHETALRELNEEVGLEATLLESAEPLTSEYVFVRNGEQIEKEVEYFVGVVINTELTLLEKEIQEATWLSPEEARAQLTFEDHKILLDKALRSLDK